MVTEQYMKDAEIIMLPYKKVLAAVDIGDQSKKLNETIQGFVDAGDEVHLCSAVLPLEAMYVVSQVGDNSIAARGFHKELLQHALNSVNALGKSFGLESEVIHLLVGRAPTEIKSLAEKDGFDLIVIGTHGKNALRAALGSTSNGVLHGAPCDVLAVKYEKPDE